VKDAADRGVREAVAPDRSGRVLLFPERRLADADDASVVRVLREGDPRAPRVVWQRFAPMVHRILKRAFGPDYDIDDLVQEVFLVLFDRVATLREPNALRAFIISITAHTIRRELRRKTAARWLMLGDTSTARAREADLDSRGSISFSIGSAAMTVRRSFSDFWKDSSSSKSLRPPRCPWPPRSAASRVPGAASSRTPSGTTRSYSTSRGLAPA
jgi:RNA polymerase sigma factor (sigma-70 family)